MKRVLFAGALGALAALGGMAAAQAVEDAQMRVYPVAADFADARLDLETAIVSQGLVIDYEGFVGDMLNRTAADVGAERQVYTRADMFQFCSATLSRRMMEADPNNIAFCPFVVFVYERTEGGVHVGYRRPPETGSEEGRAALAAVDALLDRIVREAAGL